MRTPGVEKGASTTPPESVRAGPRTVAELEPLVTVIVPGALDDSSSPPGPAGIFRSPPPFETIATDRPVRRPWVVSRAIAMPLRR